MRDLEQLVRPHILDLTPYSSARDDFEGSADVYLDANENALGSIPEGQLNRYPDPHQVILKSALGKIKSINSDQIFIGNGSDEPIDLLIRAFCEPGQDAIIVMPPTYGMYAVSAKINDVQVRSIPLKPDFQLDVHSIKQSREKFDKILFICNPNNPSGNLLNERDILEIIDWFDGLVVVDEAYIDFAQRDSLIEHISRYPNVVVLQTFSKSWGLAAIRLGVAYGDEFVIKMLNKIKPPYNIDQLTQETGIRAIENIDRMNAMVNTIITERESLMNELDRINSVDHVYPSDTNFILTRFQNHDRINQYLRKNRVIVRDRSQQLFCEGCLRITVGTAVENNRLLDLLRNFK